MKKLLNLILILFFISNVFGYSSKIVQDSGYYYGVIDDSLKNKYIFMVFLSNGGDDMLYVVPYILINKDINFIKKKFIESLNNIKDDIDGNILIEKTWTIPGFDNFPYYTYNDGNISFCLNIANINNNHLDIFEFKGKLLDDGRILSILSSTNELFDNKTLILTYKKLPK
jgi:hypothetical protein